jgi:hypothetical protein
MWNRIAEKWCKKMHTKAMWPMHGKYVCPRCLREFAVDWEGPPTPEEYSGLAEQEVRVEIAPRVWLPD